LQAKRQKMEENLRVGTARQASPKQWKSYPGTVKGWATLGQLELLSSS
jgi:hypothetical protein